MSDAAEREVAYIVHREGLNSVFQSQMLTPMRRHHEAGGAVRIVALCALGEFFRKAPRTAWHRIRNSLPERGNNFLYRLPSPPSRFLNAWNEAAVLAAWLRNLYGRGPWPILHGAGAEATTIALDAAERHQKETPVVYNAFGLRDVEYLYENGYAKEEDAPTPVARLAKLYRERQQRAATSAQAIVAVSNAMRDYLVEAYGARKDRIVIIPCCVDTDRFTADAGERAALRKELGWADNFIVTYCGSYHRWQCPSQSAELFMRIKKLDPSARYLVLTPSVDRMRAATRAAGVADQDLCIRRVPYPEVPRYLAAADAGLLLREPSLVNRVASPVKFAEYMACGVPVILSPGIGDFSAAVEDGLPGRLCNTGSNGAHDENGLGDFIADTRRRRDEVGRICADYAKDHLSWTAYRPVLEELYGRLGRAC